MGKEFTNRQRTNQYGAKGRPVLALEFDAWANGDVSMWVHSRHEIPFAEMLAAFEAIQGHLARFIADAGICPFNPAFRNDGGGASAGDGEWESTREEP